MDYVSRMEDLVITKLYNDGVDMSCKAHMTIQRLNDEYVTVVLSQYDTPVLEVWKTDEYGSAEILVEAPEDLDSYEMYGDYEVTIDPDNSPARIYHEEVSESNMYERFVSVCGEYLGWV